MLGVPLVCRLVCPDRIIACTGLGLGRYEQVELGCLQLSAGLTTFTSGLLLQFATLLFFMLFGTILMLTMFFSLVSAFVYFPSLLACVAPETSFGSVPRHMVPSFIRRNDGTANERPYCDSPPETSTT